MRDDESRLVSAWINSWRVMLSFLGTKVVLMVSSAALFVTVLLVWIFGIPAEATIDWNDAHQTIDGFGASSADFLNSLTPQQADFFFTQEGIGFSILRVQIIPDRQTCDEEFHRGACKETNGLALDGELHTAQLAVARGAIVVASPWSPPGVFKTNGSFKNGGSLRPDRYGEWAQRIASFVVMMQHNGVPIYAVSVQNEPDLTTEYGSCKYTAQQIHDFVPYLHEALQSVGVGSTKIMIAEESTWKFDLTTLAMSDPAVATDIGIVAAHGYHDDFGPYSTGAARLWQTEDSSQLSNYDGSIADGIRAAHSIHGFLSQANINAWLWWFLTNMPKQGEGKDNSALTDIHGSIPKRAYVTAQWSRFVRSGWIRISVSNLGPVEMTAFKDDKTRAFAIISINKTALPVSTSFSLKGFAAGSITPWITSEKLSLAAQPKISANGSAFSYTLPPMSVTTFQGAAETSAAK
jgi:O-glycosyl hydrolase